MQSHYWMNARLASRLTRRSVLAGAAGSAASVYLAACARGRSAKSSQPSTTIANQPKNGGTLNTPLAADMFNFDVTGNGKTIPNPNGFMLACDTVVTFKQGPDLPYDQNTIIPNLAQSWESPDAATYTFHLNKAAKFANLAPVNGRALTSADVQWSYDYHARTGVPAFSKLPAGNFSYMFQGLQSIETPDASTVVVKFAQPFAPFLTYNFTFGLPIYPHEIYDQYGNFNDHLVGSGPYQLDTAQTQHGTRWVFTKSSNFWQAGKPHLDAIRYLVLPDDSARYAAFQTGQMQLLPGVADLTATATIKKAAPAAIVQQGFNPQAQQMYINQRRAPFADVRLRLAMSLGLDRDAFIQTFAGGQGGWIMADALPGLWTDTEVHQVLKEDPTQAKQLLSAAGYTSGLDVDLMLQTGNAQSLAATQLLQAQMKTIGINITIQPVDGATFSSKLHSGDFTLTPTLELIFADLDSRLENFYSTSASNWIGIKDTQLDKLIDAQRSASDPAVRRDALRTVTKYMNDNAVSLAFYQTPVATFSSPSLKNYGDNWQQFDLNARNIWLAA